MKNKYTLTVRGRWHEWAFPIWAEHKHVEEWRADGLDVTLTLNDVPQWAVELGLGWIWMKAQDFFQIYRKGKWGK